MYYYNFTNDLRISNLDGILKDAANAFLVGPFPNASDEKSKNNNYNTVGFYFNLKAKGSCAKLASQGNISKVVLNFVKKFQFPNPRTPEDLRKTSENNIKLAPMREIIKLLFVLSLINTEESFLTENEIVNFIFYNDNVAKRENYNLLNTAQQIILYRKNKIYPDNINTNKTEHEWNQPERQVREMIKTLMYTGCIIETDDKKIKLISNNIRRDNEADLFEIINYDVFWSGSTLEDYQLYMDEGLENDLELSKTNKKLQSETSFYTQNSSQIIYYGVPGSGKSHKIDEITKNVPDDRKMRVVFHPEYTNADFVGQIMPSINQEGNVEYKFIPGPFAQILRKAYLNPTEKYCLVIEEINRGNAAAIFGDIFQLLDRLKENEVDDIHGNYTKGWSKYFVTNDFVNWYIRQNVIETPDQDTENGVAKIDEKEPKSINIGNLHFSANTGIRLPPNLSILATMNTSDQNVFALDNAFQRRWDMELVPNTCDDKIQMNALIENTSYTWGQFQSTINSIISEKSNSTGLSSMEDKRLGCWFVKACEYEAENKEKKFRISKKIFANKVLKYLWDDAFKFCHNEIFAEGLVDFENLQNTFYKSGFGIFSEESGIINSLNSLQSSDTTTQSPS